MYKIVSILVFALLVAIFAYLNSAPVNLWLPFIGNKEVVQSFVILGSATAGAVIVLLAGMIAQFKNLFKIRDYRNKIAAFENKIKELQEELEETRNKELKLAEELDLLRGAGAETEESPKEIQNISQKMETTSEEGMKNNDTKGESENK